MSTLTKEPAGPAAQAPSARGAARSIPQKRSRSNTKFLIAGLVIVAAIGYMIFSAIQSGSEYYVTTSELGAMGSRAIGEQLKIGGQVVEGSVKFDRGANSVSFAITDGTKEFPVFYKGVIPDTFQAGAGVILEGKLGADGTFQASTMLAKCASKYEPK